MIDASLLESEEALFMMLRMSLGRPQGNGDMNSLIFVYRLN